MNFFKMESCGICTPCRAGNQILHEKIKKLKRGLGSQQDLDEIKEWSKIIKLSSRCGLGKTSSNSITMSIDKFKDYYHLLISPTLENQNVEFDMEAAIFDYDYLIKETQN